jgi:hypothetical protein
MKSSLFLILFIFSFRAMATCPSSPCTVDIVPATNNLAATYNTSFPQQVIASLPHGYGAHFAIINENAVGVCCEISTGTASSAPSVGDGREMCVPAAWGFAWDNVSFAKGSVYCRSASGTLSSGGTIHIQVW